MSEIFHKFICIKLFEATINSPEAIFKQQNACSNHEIRVPFEHDFDEKVKGKQ